MNRPIIRQLIVCTFCVPLILGSCKPSLYQELGEHISIIVSKDGTGDLMRVKEAISVAKDHSHETTLIFIRNGVYHEKIVIPNEKTHITFFGEDVDSTILTFDDRSVYTRELNTFTSHSVRVDASDVRFYNLTIQNTARGSQAVALHGNGDRQMFVHCRILGWQGTYYSDMRSRLVAGSIHWETM